MGKPAFLQGWRMYSGSNRVAQAGEPSLAEAMSARRLVDWVRRQDAAVLGAIGLTLLYLSRYLGDAALPGNNAEFPLGWWGWFDQSKFLQSAQALRRLDLAPEKHWYPLGYAFLGAPFARVERQHLFFFVDIGSLLIAYFSFIHFSTRCAVPRTWAVILFVLAVAADPALFRQWIIPWNTSPLAAVMWLLLSVAAAHIQGTRRPVLLGVLAIAVPILRPTDAVIAAAPVAASLISDLLGRRLRFGDVAQFTVAALLPLASYCALHIAIYGLEPSAYLRGSREIGFTLHNFGLKAYLILIDPYPWIGGGEGLIRRCPWLLLGLAGLLSAVRRPLPAMLAATLMVHGVLYLSYVDLLPTGFWRYHNVHYWVFTFPGFALLGFLLLRDLTARRTRNIAIGALVLVLAFLCIRLDPETVDSNQSADAVDLSVDLHDFESIYFGTLTIQDAVGTLDNVRDIRAFPFPGGIRVLALTRALHGPVSALGQGIDLENPQKLRAAIRFGLPFWPWHRAGRFFGPQN